MNMKRKFNSPRIPPGLPAWLAKEWMDGEFEWDAPVPKASKKKARVAVLAKKKEVPVVVAVPSAAEKKAKRDAKFARKRLRWRCRKRLKRRCAAIGRQIAREFEDERKKLLAATLKALAQEKLELALMAFDEKQAAERKAYFDECKRSSAAYIEKLKQAAA